MDTATFVRTMPKVELHLHVEGTLEPEAAFAFAKRNGVSLPYASPEDLRAAYDFADLQSFLDLYHATCSVLLTRRDFYDLTWAYIEHAAEENIRHVAVFCDPQTHSSRRVAMSSLVRGIACALTHPTGRPGPPSRPLVSVRPPSPLAASPAAPPTFAAHAPAGRSGVRPSHPCCAPRGPDLRENDGDGVWIQFLTEPELPRIADCRLPQAMYQARIAGAGAGGRYLSAKAKGAYAGTLTDRMLLEVANTLRAKQRTYDLTFRYGGDEFVCALPGLNLSEATIRMALVNAALADAPEHGSVTVGVAELQADDSLESLIERADAALYLERDQQRTLV